MRTVVTLGESLIDFVPSDSNQQGDDSCFYKKAGGAPANVAACVGRLGGQAAFIGKRGTDAFGEFLKDTLEQCRVNTQYFTATAQAKTALAFVTLDANGDRSFLFYRDPSADMLLDKADIPVEYIESSVILHIGSISLISEPSRSATIHAVQEAKRSGAFVSFDPNWRPALWYDEKYGIESMELIFPYCSLIKINREELLLLAQTNDVEAGAAYFHHKGIPFVLITLDADGCFYSFRSENEEAPRQGWVKGLPVACVDTTGAGDSFIGSFLYRLSLLDKPNLDAMEESVKFSICTSALVTLKKGAISAMPSLDEVEAFRRASGIES